MYEIIKYRKKTGIIWLIVLSMLVMTFTGCKARDKIFTVGIVSHVSSKAPILEGFKKGMAEMGYIEGENIKYIFKGVLEADEQGMDGGIKELLSQDIDLLLTTGDAISLRAKELVKGSDMPVLFSSNTWPVEVGLVSSLIHPGGNLTGIRFADTIPKALEWLTIITPGSKKVYLPYNPNDAVSINFIPVVDKTASQLGIELILHKIYSVEEAVKGIEDLTEDVNAILMIPSTTLNTRSIELSRAAIRMRRPIGATLQVDEDVLVTFTNDYFDAGKKTARLAKQIFQGAKPADLPVETSEVFLSINLRTAEKIGIHISDDILAQATTIIR